MVVDTFSRKPNGLDRPLYFDRQLLQAEDLSLEQGFGDFRLALLARNCIGWGVAAGLILRIEAGGGSAGALSVSPGYALTSMGREVYLPAEVRFDAIEALIRELCRDMPDCTNVDAPGTGENRGSSVTAWVIARIAEQDGGLRTSGQQHAPEPSLWRRADRDRLRDRPAALRPAARRRLPAPHGLRPVGPRAARQSRAGAGLCRPRACRSERRGTLRDA